MKLSLGCSLNYARGIDANSLVWDWQPTADLSLTPSVGPALDFTRLSASHVWDADQELVSVANDIPRFGHVPATGVSRGLFVEGAVSQFLGGADPEDFNDSASGWLGSNNVRIIATPNLILGVDGTMSGWKFEAKNTGNDRGAFLVNLPYVAAATYCVQGYFKAGTATGALLHGNSIDSIVAFNLSAGTVDYTTGADYVRSGMIECPNDWWLCYIVFTANGPGNHPNWGISDDGSSRGSTLGNYNYCMRPMVSLGGYPKTWTAATQAAEVVTSDLTSWWPGWPVTVIGDFEVPTERGVVDQLPLVSFDDGTATDYIAITRQDASGLRLHFGSGFATIPDGTDAGSGTGTHRFAARLEPGSLAFYVDGSAVSVSDSTYDFSAFSPTQMRVGNCNYSGIATQVDSYCRELKIYKTAFSNDDLAAASTLT